MSAPPRGRRLVTSVGLITITNVWASGSSLVLFGIAARQLDVHDLGTLVLLLACVQLVTYLADGGLTAFVVREVARSDSLTVLKWNMNRRGLVAAAASTPALLIVHREASVAEFVLVLAASIANSWYSVVVAVLFAVDRPRRVAVIQLMNGALFISSSLLVAAFWPTPVGFLTAVCSSYYLLLLTESRLLSDVMRSSKTRPRLSGQLPFMVSGLAYGVNSVADSILLGRRSPTGLAEYAGAQRVALGVGALGRAASGLLLPAFSRRPVAIRPSQILGWFCASAVLGGLLGMLLTPVANIVYDEDLADSSVMFCLFAAYASDVLLVVVSANLTARGHEGALAMAAVAQLAVTVTAIVLLVPTGPAGVAASVLMGRSVTALLLVGLEIRSNRGAPK